MATIEQYETAAGKRYQVRYRTSQRTQTKKRGFKTKRDAKGFAATVEVEKMTGAYVAPSLEMITVGELAPAWLSRKQSDVAPSNYRTLESAWRIHVKPVWGTTRVAYLPRPKSDGGWFVGAVKRAKVQKITPHDLRHSCASIAISSGVNVLALSRMLGHTSAKVTLDTYADLFDTDLDAVAAALDLKCAHSVPKARPVTAVEA
jgi:hypothetical protein